MKRKNRLIPLLILAGFALSANVLEGRTLRPVRTIDPAIPFIRTETPQTIQETPDSGQVWFDRACVALGGIEAVKAVKSITSKVVLVQTTAMGDMTMGGELVVVYPDRFRASLTTPYGSIQMVLTDIDAWMVVEGRGTAALPEYQKKVMQEAQYRDAVVLFTNQDAYQFRHVGRQTFFGMDAVDLEVKRGEYVFHMFLNPQSGLPVGYSYAESGPQGLQDKEERSSEYQTINGYAVPMKSEVFSAGKKESETRITECRVNAPIEESWFQKQ